MKALSGPFAERRFRWYFLSRSVNLAGATMAPVALAFAVLELHSSPAALGLVLAARSIPQVLFLLVGGVVANRVGLTRVVQLANIGAALSQGTLAYLVLCGRVELWHFVALSVINGTLAAISMPALAAMVPDLVPRDQLQPANVAISMTRSALTVLGPSAAAALVVTAGPGWALALDAVAWAASAALLLPIRTARPSGADIETSFAEDLVQGWSYFRHTNWLWTVVVSFTVLNAIYAGGFDTLGPVLATETSIGARGWGLIMSAQALGLFVMTLILLRVRIERPLFAGMLGVSLMCLPLFAIALHPSTMIVVLAAFVAGLGVEIFNLGWALAIQENVPSSMLSRAYSYDLLGSFAAIPVGQLTFGPLADAYGAQSVLFAAAVVYLAVAALTLTSSSVRTLRRVSTPELVGEPG